MIFNFSTRRYKGDTVSFSPRTGRVCRGSWRILPAEWPQIGVVGVMFSQGLDYAVYVHDASLDAEGVSLYKSYSSDPSAAKTLIGISRNRVIATEDGTMAIATEDGTKVIVEESMGETGTKAVWYHLIDNNDGTCLASAVSGGPDQI